MQEARGWAAIRETATLGLPDGADLASATLWRVDRHTIRWQVIQARRGLPAQEDAGESAIGWRWLAKWAQYEVSLFGVLRPLPAPPAPWPYWTLSRSPGGPQPGDACIQLYLQTASCPGVAPFAEWTWHPVQGSRSAIRGADGPDVPDEDVLRARRGLQLLEQLPGAVGGGRPPGSGNFRSREEFREVVLPVIRHLSERGAQPTQADVAREIKRRLSGVRRFAGFTDRRLREALGRFEDVDWPTLVGEALGRA